MCIVGSIPSSVTRLGDISALWQICSLWREIESIFSIEKKFEPILAIYFVFGTIFIIVPKWLNIEQTVCPSGHTCCNAELTNR